MLLEVYLEQSGQLLLHQSLDLLLAQGVWFTIGTRVRVEGVHQDGHGRLQLRHGCRCWRGPKRSARTSLKGAGVEGVEAQRGGKSFYTFRERDRFYRSGDSVFYQGGGSNCVNTAAIINRPGCVAFRSSLSFSCRTIGSKGVLILTRF